MNTNAKSIFLEMLLATLGMGMSQTATATPMSDQSNTETRSAGYLVGGFNASSLAQEVTSGLSGLLTGFSLDLYGLHPASAGNTNIYLRGTLTGPNLASFSVANKNPILDGFILFDTSGMNIFTAVGSSLFLVLEPAEAASFGTVWDGRTVSNPNPYSGGSSWSRNQTVNWTQGPYDLRFQTFVDPEILETQTTTVPNPAPEPASLALLAMGLFGMIGSHALRKERPGSGDSHGAQGA